MIQSVRRVVRSGVLKWKGDESIALFAMKNEVGQSVALLRRGTWLIAPFAMEDEVNTLSKAHFL